MSDAIRILVADDHPVVRDGLVMMLDTQDDFEVVGEASDGKEAVQKAQRLAAGEGAPDILLLDLEMPEMDGIAVIDALEDALPDTRVIVFTAFDTDERIFAAVRAGAKGYLLKGSPRADIFEAIRTVHGGGSLLHPVAASKLMQHVQDASDTPQESLSAREQEVLEIMAKGMQNQEIARQLGISERTVKFHVSSILAKLDVSNRTEAVSMAVQMGILRL